MIVRQNGYFDSGDFMMSPAEQEMKLARLRAAARGKPHITKAGNVWLVHDGSRFETCEATDLKAAFARANDMAA